MGKYEDLSIRKVVSGINEKYFLPEIQREFVWNDDRAKFEDKIYDLFDSILRDYPIGTFLFWEVKYENLISDNITVLKFLENSNNESETVEKQYFQSRGCVLVLDGQQRMTILNLALRGVFEEERKNKKIKRYLYFNLLSSPLEKKEVTERLFEFKLFDKEYASFIEDGKVWWRVNQVFHSTFRSYSEAKEISKKHKVKDADEDIIADNLNRIETVFSKEILSYYIIDDTKTDEEALEIFVRVNSGGVTLTYSDLLFSKIKQYWKKGDEKIDAREEFKDFLRGVNQESFDFDNDFILKTSLMLIDKDIKYKIKNFNKDNVLLIKQNWNNIKRSIQIIVEFLKMINISSKRCLRSNNAIIPLVHYVYLNASKEIDPASKNFNLMKKYIYAVLLNGTFGGQSDSLLTDCRTCLKDSKGDLFPLEDIFKAFSKRNRTIRRGPEIKELIREIRYDTDKSKLILSILYGNNLMKDFHEDHMFSRTKYRKMFDKSKVDNITNIQALGGFTNICKSDMPFEEWLKDKDRSEDYMEIHLVPRIENYNENSFEQFMEQRSQMICKKLELFFG